MKGQLIELSFLDIKIRTSVFKRLRNFTRNLKFMDVVRDLILHMD